MKSLRLLVRYVGLILIAAAILLPSSGAQAQGNSLNIDIREIDLSQFPSVLLRVNIRKPLNSNISVDAGNAILSENGILQTIDYFECPQDSTVRLSLAILVDRSRSMRLLPNGDDDPDSTKIHAAVSAIRSFLDLLGDRDEAAIFSFATSGVFIPIHLFTVEHDFSTDHESLKDALGTIVADGGTSLWEAIIDALDRLYVRPGRKALIVLTDGRNRSRQNLRSRAIQNAVDRAIPVYPIGLGDDIDVGELSGLASATGGKFYAAPDAADLQDIFNSIGSELITDDCVLRYTSSNPCLDGSVRNIELTLSGTGFFGEDDTSYTVERRLNPVTLFVEQGIEVEARDTVDVPVTVIEQFSTSQPLTCSVTMSYDVSLMRFLAVQTLGTMSENQDIQVFEDRPGELRFELTNFLPAIPTGHLFELRFISNAQSVDSTTRIEITGASFAGLCPFETSTSGAGLLITACTQEFTLGSGKKYVVGDGSEVLVPVTISPRPQPGTPLNMRFSIAYANPSLEYLGIERNGTISEKGNLLVQDAGDVLELYFEDDAVRGGDTLLLLRFRGFGGKSPSVHPLRLTLAEMITGCRVAAAVDPPIIVIDGICQPIVRRKEPLPELSNHPNPFTGETTLTFALPEDAAVELELLDGNGRRVRTLLSAHLRAGTYEHRAFADDLPAGDYLAVLRVNGIPIVRRVLLLR